MIFVLGLLALVLALVAAGALRWRSATANLHARIESARLPVAPEAVGALQFADAPEPVQQYFRQVFTGKTTRIATAEVEHTGTFDMSETGAAQWKPFTSRQRVVTRRPGFVWDASIRMMPGLPVRVHDAYVAGEGILHAALFGLISVANLRGEGDLAEGELMRFLAEAAWYPTALLPGEGVAWNAVDRRSARATLEDGRVSSTLLFTFDSGGLIDTVYAPARARTVNGAVIPTPWQGRFWNYVVQDGLRVPLDGEVAWLLPDGPRPYWRGHITSLRYEYAHELAVSTKP